jgi:hypothetical protein
MKNIIKNKTLAIFGIGAYILTILLSATDLVPRAIRGTSIPAIALVAIARIALSVFTIMATIRLWKVQRTASVLLVSSFLILLILPVVQMTIILPGIILIINFITFTWAVILLWAIAKNEGRAKKFLKDSGLTPDEFSLVQEDLQKGNHKSAEQRIALAQERQREEYKEATGVDPKDMIPEIGKDISWAYVVNHVFRIIEFDRSDTTIDQNKQVKAKSLFKPYGYLLVESPIFNQKVRLPIIHRDDFLLAASVFDEPELEALVAREELLVTYAPKHLLPEGLSGSPHHVLHYVLTPRGTLDPYYSMNNDIHMAKPDPQILFGPFVYEGEIKVQINSEPEL